MYAWIWRHLPFGRYGRWGGSVVLVAAAVALLWYVVFPWAEPILPFDDVQVGTEVPGGGPAPGDPGDPAVPGAPESPGDHDIEYNTESNNPAPPPAPTNR